MIKLLNILNEILTEKLYSKGRIVKVYKSLTEGDNKNVECEKCGWKWSTKDSKEYDKYVCHKCGYDNSNIYTN
jgi:Zn finger protein HypA/HybF involved in hydrogenase expression